MVIFYDALPDPVIPPMAYEPTGFKLVKIQVFTPWRAQRYPGLENVEGGEIIEVDPALAEIGCDGDDPPGFGPWGERVRRALFR